MFPSVDLHPAQLTMSHALPRAPIGSARLERYFGTDPRFWLNLQAADDPTRAA